MHGTSQSRAGARAGRREWVGLAVLALPTLLVSIDIFVMLLALPHLSVDLGASGVQQLWIIDIYGFLLAGFLVTMGSLGDRIGRRRLLLLGATAFVVASVLCAYATSPGMLIAGRAILGIAGATLAPSTLSLITTMFHDPRERGMAIGLWMACFAGGAMIGPIVGGTLLDTFWWGSVFLLGIPAMGLLLVLGPVLLPEYRVRDAGRLDFASVALSLATILPIVYGFKEIAKGGWRALPSAAIALGIVAGGVFIRRQRRLADPLLDLRLFSSRAFSTALGGIFFGTMLTGTVMLFVTQYLQLVSGKSTLGAGLWMMPAILTNTVSFIVSPIIGRRVRPAYLIGIGLAISVVGLLVMARAGASGEPVILITGFALIFLGAGPMVTLSTALVVGTAPQDKAGSAAALNETSGQLGFALGVAALGTLATAVYRSRIGNLLPEGLPAGIAASARDTLTGAVDAAPGLPDRLGAALLGAGREAFTTGMHTAVVVSAILLATVAVLVATLLRHVPPTGQERPEAPAGPDDVSHAVPGQSSKATLR